MSEEVRFHVNSIFNSVSYRVGSILIDPGDEWLGFRSVNAILLTHAHFDHIYGLNRVVELNPDVNVYTSKTGLDALLSDKLNISRYYESPFIFKYLENVVMVHNRNDVQLDDGVIAKAVLTPGHNPSCITWVIEDCIFTGDFFIPGMKTVTNLPGGGDKAEAIMSEDIIKRLAKGRRIFPGHKVEL